MPDKRSHRGQHPKDVQWFGPKAVSSLRQAVSDLSWLLTRGYSAKSAVKLVGDRYSLTERQRAAVGRSACSDTSLTGRLQREVTAEAVCGQTLLLDGYNQLVTTEAALSGGVLLRGRDGAYRDLASVHGTYRRVEETVPALQLIGRELSALESGRLVWFLDRPVSNSGRLKQLMLEVASGAEWDWEVELVWAPDRAIVQTEGIAVSSDSWVLDNCGQWFNLTAFLCARVPCAVVVALGPGASP